VQSCILHAVCFSVVSLMSHGVCDKVVMRICAYCIPNLHYRKSAQQSEIPEWVILAALKCMADSAVYENGDHTHSLSYNSIRSCHGDARRPYNLCVGDDVRLNHAESINQSRNHA